jgi:hypothetical protein
VQNNLFSDFSNSSSVGEYAVLLKFFFFSSCSLCLEGFHIVHMLNIDTVYMKSSTLCHFSFFHIYCSV